MHDGTSVAKNNVHAGREETSELMLRMRPGVGCSESSLILARWRHSVSALLFRSRARWLPMLNDRDRSKEALHQTLREALQQIMDNLR